MKARDGGAYQAVGFAQLPTNLTCQVTANCTCRKLARPVSHTNHELSPFVFYVRPFPLPQTPVFNHLGCFSLELLRLPHRLLQPHGKARNVCHLCPRFIFRRMTERTSTAQDDCFDRFLSCIKLRHCFV